MSHTDDLTRGTIVKTRWGLARVEAIELVALNESDGGSAITAVPWECLNDRYVVDLDNGHWASGSQITKASDDEAKHYAKSHALSQDGLSACEVDVLAERYSEGRRRSYHDLPMAVNFHE